MAWLHYGAQMGRGYTTNVCKLSKWPLRGSLRTLPPHGAHGGAAMRREAARRRGRAAPYSSLRMGNVTTTRSWATRTRGSPTRLT